MVSRSVITMMVSFTAVKNLEVLPLIPNTLKLRFPRLVTITSTSVKSLLEFSTKMFKIVPTLTIPILNSVLLTPTVKLSKLTTVKREISTPVNILMLPSNCKLVLILPSLRFNGRRMLLTVLVLVLTVLLESNLRKLINPRLVT